MIEHQIKSFHAAKTTYFRNRKYLRMFLVSDLDPLIFSKCLVVSFVHKIEMETTILTTNSFNWDFKAHPSRPVNKYILMLMKVYHTCAKSKFKTLDNINQSGNY
ncbi:hypothetical protein O6H91_17G046700 [Diphasiastrum complanatum]|uniref:Uncharacterized protein n=1 Tax=Diphasiastrum complanatum TaxID=34168 RepID=A0ACC2B6E0_DIPCM|nr:hypothetical protein O6H91_17G046700 [Diphasiastrum complanatum]